MHPGCGDLDAIVMDRLGRVVEQEPMRAGVALAQTIGQVGGGDVSGFAEVAQQVPERVGIGPTGEVVQVAGTGDGGIAGGGFGEICEVSSCSNQRMKRPPVSSSTVTPGGRLSTRLTVACSPGRLGGRGTGIAISWVLELLRGPASRVPE